VLHVGWAADAGSGAVSHPAGRFLTSCSAGVEHCGDVYRAMARLCRNRGSLPRAVVVCMDTVGTPELEFFSVVARMFRRLPVYVYGGERSRSRMARAIQLGAAGEASESAIRSLFERPGVRVIESTREVSCGADSSGPAAGTDVGDVHVAGAVADEADVARAVAVGGDAGDVSAAENELVDGDYAPGRAVTEEAFAGADREDVGAVSDALVDEAPPEGGLTEHDEAHEPARVPWLTYSDRPARHGPSNGGSAQVEASSEERPVRPRIAERPLLTAEELEALIGDLDSSDAELPEEEERG